LLLLVESVSN